MQKIKNNLIIIMLFVVILIQFIGMRNLHNQFSEDKSEKTRQIQRLDAGITFQSKRAKFLLVARDSIIKTHNKGLSDGEAYSIAEFALYVCEKYQINPVLLFAIGRQESRFDIKAVNQKSGAKGIYQIFPLTGRMLCDVMGMEYVEEMLFNMKINTEMAGKYLNYLHAEYDNMETILVGYNAGPTWANRHRLNKKTRLPEETVEYIRAVKQYYNEFGQKLAFYLPGEIAQG